MALQAAGEWFMFYYRRNIRGIENGIALLPNHRVVIIGNEYEHVIGYHCYCCFGASACQVTTRRDDIVGITIAFVW